MVFSSFESDRPIRFAGQAKQSAGCRRARQTRGARYTGKKKACWVDHPTGFSLPEGWTSRHTWTWRLYTNHSTENARSAAATASAAKGSSRSKVISRSPVRQAKKQKTRWLWAYRVFELRRPSLQGKGSTKATQQNMHAAHPPRLRGSSMRIAWWGSAS